ncbi:MAG: hypothetical protein JSS22_14790 [Proteobacteria bacterium]|nr:hypothetical protein [Pseudomonadota bacterium]
MRVQAQRQGKDILSPQRAGINSPPAEVLLARMQTNIDNLCVERDRLEKLEPGPVSGKVLGGRKW